MGERYLTTANCATSYKELEDAMKRVDKAFYTDGFIPTYKYPQIKKVIYNFKNTAKPTTIVFFDDGSKVVVKCSTGEFTKEGGLAQCYLKKILGSRGNIQKLIENADIQE